MSKVLELKHIKKGFAQGKETLEIIRGASLEVHRGEIVALVGPSGAGKSTLLQMIGLLDSVDEGDILIDGQSCAQANDAARTAIRRDKCGFVYQYHHLLPEFTACENVMMPLLIAKHTKADAKEHAVILLKQLGLEERLDHRPSALSGGEQQRVAIARAMVGERSLLLADEPTGNLDPQTADQVFSMLVTAARDKQLGALVVTHNYQLAEKMDRVVELKDGVLV